MEEQSRLEHYLAWRRAQRKERRRRIYRRLRTGAMVALLALTSTTVAVALYGWMPSAEQATVHLPAQASDVEPRPLAIPQPAAVPAVSTPPAPDVNVREPMSPPPAPPRARVRQAEKSRSTVRRSTPPVSSTGAAAPAPASQPPAVATNVPSAVAANAPSEDIEKPRAVTTEVIVMPPAPSRTVVVEPSPARQSAALAPAVTAPGTPVNNGEPARMEQLKRLTGYIPEVWLARTVARWVKAQPPGELPPPASAAALPQAR